MSWLAKSLVNTLRGDDVLDDDDDDDAYDDESEEGKHDRSHIDSPAGGVEASEEPGTPTRGVKEDISELTKTLTQRFWGVASFLAPPPNTSIPEASDPPLLEELGEAEGVESPRNGGIRSDLAEISGKVRSGISILSNTKAVSEISKIASTFLSFDLDEELGYEEEDEDDNENEEEPRIEDNAVGVTEDVVIYARNVSMHPETWLDFPIDKKIGNFDDFEMSDIQREHAANIERLAPRLAALRIELCPSHMSEGCFWKIYFVLLHSRPSNKHDAEFLFTPQIVEARAVLLQDLPSRVRPECGKTGTEEIHIADDATAAPFVGNLKAPSPMLNEDAQSQTISSRGPRGQISVPDADVETEKYPIETTEVEVVDISVIEEPLMQIRGKDSLNESSKVPVEQFEEGVDDWLEDETGEVGATTNIDVSVGQEEDVSFSDLEED